MSASGDSNDPADICATAGAPERRVDGKRLRQAKRQRFLEKQRRAAAAAASPSMRPDWLTWIACNGSFAQLATPETIDTARNDPSSQLYPYFDLQERPCRSDGGRDLFIAEGTETIRLLIQQCQKRRHPYLDPIRLKSVFLKPSVMFDSAVNLRHDVEQAKDGGCDRPPFDVVIADDHSTQSLVAGFEVSRGALACGVVPAERDWNWLLRYLDHVRRYKQKGSTSPATLSLVALDGVSDTANLGSVIRTSSAFAVDAILLSSTCCDPWYRRTVRVSMGHVSLVPCIRIDDLPRAVKRLAQDPYKVTSYAAVVQSDADLVLESLGKGDVSSSWMAVFGNEATGISSGVIDACDSTIRIDMDATVDSLSLPVAAGILLHGLKERVIFQNYMHQKSSS